MKILSDAGLLTMQETVTAMGNKKYMNHYISITEAQRDKTLRQVIELLVGIENPYNDTMTGCLSRDYRIQHTTFEEAIQTMKALLEGK